MIQDLPENFLLHLAQSSLRAFDQALSESSILILLVRFGAMGDIVHSLPAAAALRRGFPTARIDWLVERRWSPLLATAPAGPLDEVIAVDTFALRRSLTSREGWRPGRAP